MCSGKKLGPGAASPLGTAFCRGVRLAGAVGAVLIPAGLILVPGPVEPAAPALLERPVCTAVIAVAGLFPHKALKGPVAAICEKHSFASFPLSFGLYKKCVSA